MLVLDNVSWHKVKRLNWYHFEPEYAPPRSPDLNAIERRWLRMKADWFNGWIAKSVAPSLGQAHQDPAGFDPAACHSSISVPPKMSL